MFKKSKYVITALQVIIPILLMYIGLYLSNFILNPGTLKALLDKDRLSKDIIISGITQWNFFQSSVGYLTITFPIFLLIIYFNLYEELNSYFIFGRIRMKRYLYTIAKRLLFYAVFTAISMTLATLIYYSILHLVLPYSTDMLLESTGYITSFTLNESVFGNSPVLYFYFITLVNHLPIFFCYGIMFGTVTLVTHQHRYYFIAIPFIIMFIGIFIGNAIFTDFNYFSIGEPVNGYYSRISEIWRYCIYPLVISGVLFLYYYRNIKLGVDDYVKN